MPRVLVLAVLLLVCSPVLADEAAITRLGELLGAMRQVEGSFTQRLLDDKGGLLQESRGRVELAHPGRFRWETQEPFSQLVVSDGTTVWQFDPDLLQVVVRALDRRADQVPSMLLAGEIEAVKAQYEIGVGMDAEGRERFELIPRAAGGPFARLSLAFRDGRLSLLEMRDGLGQRTEVAFPELRPLASTDPGRFRFETPPGVDEIRDE